MKWYKNNALLVCTRHLLDFLELHKEARKLQALVPFY